MRKKKKYKSYWKKTKDTILHQRMVTENVFLIYRIGSVDEWAAVIKHQAE